MSCYVHYNEIPLYVLVWKLCHDLERERKVLKAFSVHERLIGIWSRPNDECVVPEYTSQKIGLDLKISSLITSFHQTQFIFGKQNYLAKLSSSRHLFEKLIFFLANITQIHPRISRTNSYTHKFLTDIFCLVCKTFVSWFYFLFWVYAIIAH